MRKAVSLLSILMFLIGVSLLSLSVSAETQTIQLSPGWNMFSLPLNTTLTADYIKSQCGSQNKVWNYNSVSQLYEEAIQILPGKGYWFKVDSACSVPVSGDIIQSIPGLKTGWNQVGTFSQTVTFNDVKGSCNVLSGPWRYNTVLGQYDLATSLELGYGYWIKVGSDCMLIKNCPDGTASGMCSATKPKYCDSGNLVDRCNICGCPTSQSCNSTTGSCYTPPSTCTCSSWTNGACNAGGCTNQRQQTRTCTPTGCMHTDGLGTTRCVVDSTCGTTAQYININENSVGVVPKLTWGANIVSSSNFDTLYNSISQSGITLLRTDIDLNFIFPTGTSTPNFSRLDKMISTTKKIGIEPLIIVDYTPTWLSENTGSTKYPPTDMTKFNNLVATVVNHVKDNVTYYEIWNEPDSTKFWNGTVAEYASLLRNVSQTIRSIDSNAKILAPAFSEVYAFGSKLTLLQEVCKNASSYFDIVSFHTYIFYKISLSGWLGDMNDFTLKLNQYGCGGKQMWMTEAGIFNEFLSLNYRDVFKVATIRKALLDYNSNAQIYYPFLSNSDVGTVVGLYNSSNSQFSNIGKYYQLASQLKFYGNKTSTVSNVQNNISEISYLSVKNPDNEIIIQLTNNFSTSKDVQINFQNVKNITVYESSSSQVFSSPLAVGQQSSFVLSLKPYSVYLIESKTITSQPSQFQVTVDTSKVIGSNNLSLGTFLDYPQEWKAFRDRPTQQQLARNANFKIIHIDDRHMGPSDYSKGVGPCNSWNETTKDCNKWNWTDVDSVVKAIYDSGAEPMILLSKWTKNGGDTRPDGSSIGTPTVPPGMHINSTTMLPYPSSYADFVAAWIKHFKSKGYPWNQTKYYELYGEIQTYFGWSGGQHNVTRTAYFIDIFNAAYTRMHQENPQVKVSFDASTLKWVFDRLLTNGVGIDSFNFHKYDDWKNVSLPPSNSNGAYSDDVMFQRAEDIYYQVNDSDTYEVDYVRRAWQKKTGVWPELTMSEGNWNAFCNPTDERVQEMAGAVRTALVLRMGMLKGENYNVYFRFSTDAYWEKQTWGSGRGYGLIDSDSYHTVTQSYNNPYYPYYVHNMIGPNLAVGDSIVNSYSNYNNVSSISWTHNGKLNIILIHKSKQTATISLSGVSGSFTYQKIDDPTGTSYLNPFVQTGTINAGNSITLNGYTVMLLQQTSTVTTCSDGTAFEQCSSTKPNYCNNGNLVVKCSQCGCPSGYSCQSDESCKIEIQACSIVTKFSSGRDYAHFYDPSNQGYPFKATNPPYEYVTDQVFSSVTPSGDLICRHAYCAVDDWGNRGADWAGVENILRKMKGWGAYPVLRIWLANLDMSDQEWMANRSDNTDGNPSTCGPAKNEKCPLGYICQPDGTCKLLQSPQPRMNYSAMVNFLRKLENLTEVIGFKNIIFVPAWEFNQEKYSQRWGAGGSYRNWYITPQAYAEFMGNFTKARDAVAPRIRIGVAADSGAGSVPCTASPNWNSIWSSNEPKSFEPYLQGFSKLNYSFDVFGVTYYPRTDAGNPCLTQNYISSYLGADYMGKIVNLIGLQNKTFIIYEYNTFGIRADADFINKSYNGIKSAIDQKIVNYEALCWYLLLPTQNYVALNNQSQKYYDYPLTSCLTKTCSDGTAYNSCSTTKPKYCSSGTLINKCSQCSCPTGYQCQSDGSCGLIQKCSDGTNGMSAGVNYLSSGYQYTLTQSQMNHDFQLFKQNNITLIYIDPRWDIIETSKGTYNDAYLERIKSLIKNASQYNIQVGIAFMTNTICPSSTIPSWISPKCWSTVLTDSTTKQVWINMLGHVAYYLKDAPIYSWLVLDEPYITSGYINLPQDQAITLFVDVMTQAKTAIKQYSNSPFGGTRFGCTNNGPSAFTSNFKRDDRIYSLFDFISINFYANWDGGGCSQTQCASEFQAIKAKGKPIYIGGCGEDAQDDTTQANGLSTALNFFSQNNVDGAMTWFWSSNSDFPGFTSVYWNLCKDSSGAPRAAFYKLGRICYTPPSTTCSDGTAYGQCSATKPKYCSSGTLIDKCSQCGCSAGYSCQSDESCKPTAQYQVTVDSSKIIGSNNLSLGVQPDAKWFSSSTTLKQLVSAANLKMVRFFDADIPPCNYWNEATKTGTFNWTSVDSLVQSIFNNGAEPLITLGYLNYDNVKNDYFLKLPSGMTVNPTTGLPYPDQWAAYCTEWVKHFKTTGKSVRYYEIVNEPAAYFGWANYTRIDYFIALFNAAAQAMRAENPSVLLSFEGSERKPVLNYWLNSSFKRSHQVGANLDFISFHKYDSGAIGQYNDSQLFNRAETFLMMTDPGGPEDGYYGIEDSRQKYYNARGKLIPIINSESNLDSAFSTGADPKIQQMSGAVWLALVLRTGIMKGMNQNIYFTLSSSQSWEKANKANGFGFGMINSDNNKPYYPYYVHKMIGPNLAVGDSIVNSFSSSADIRTLSWNDNGKLNILIIHNSTGTKTIFLSGVTGLLNYQKIDDPTGTNYSSPSPPQTGTIDASSVITLNGYTVMLLQPTSTQICSCGSWANGACGAGGCSSIQRQQTRTCSPTGCTPSDGLGTTRCVADSTCGSQQCTPGNDIIKNVVYPTGSCQASSTFGWSHATCGSTSVCNQGSCNLVNATLTSYTLPSGKHARSSTLSIPYTIKNTGNTPWCFLTEAGTTKADGSNIWPNKLNSLSSSSSTNDLISYSISCSDPLGTWSGSLYSYTDTAANLGWKVWGTPTFSFNVVECLNDQDCVNCKGSGYTCDLTSNVCKAPVQTCYDGTASGQCSSTKPNYCNNGNLVVKCSQCGCPSGYSCQSDESCKSTAQYQVTVDSSKVIGSNNLSLGFQLVFQTTTQFYNVQQDQTLAKQLNFKMIRVFDDDFGYGVGSGSNYLSCRNSTGGDINAWNENTKSCFKWDWQYVDKLIQNITALGAEPLIALGYACPDGLCSNSIPNGMPINSTTGLPYPASYAAYARAWVQHFNATGKSVRYYEIVNEPWGYFNWSNYTRFSYFMDLVRATAQAMRAENPNVLIGFDGSNRKPVLDYWLSNNGPNLDFISFHKYDDGATTDSQKFGLAETWYLDDNYCGSSICYYGVKTARQTYYNKRGKWIPVINSESNFDSGWIGGTDPRIYQMVGAVWEAMVLRKGILVGLDYTVYQSFLGIKESRGGFAFGMIDSTNPNSPKPLYPYYVHKMIGPNLAVGDSIVNSSSTSNIRTLSWIDNGKLNILLVHNYTGTSTLSLQGVVGQLSYQKIDDPTGTTWNTNPYVQTGTIDASSIITFNGYTVMLLRAV